MSSTSHRHPNEHHVRNKILPTPSKIISLPTVLVITIFIFILPHQATSTEPLRCALRDNPSAIKQIPSNHINDDYCDCLDGSDEPRTHACPNTSFTCSNVGYKPRTIPSSWLFDSHCDCCDGSDESPGVCDNICAKLRGDAMAEANRNAAIVKRGLVKKDLYIKDSISKSKQETEREKILTEQLSVLEEKLKKAEQSVERLEAAKELHLEAEKSPQAELTSPSPSFEQTHDQTDGETKEGEGISAGYKGKGADKDEAVDDHAEIEKNENAHQDMEEMRAASHNDDDDDVYDSEEEEEEDNEEEDDDDFYDPPATDSSASTTTDKSDSLSEIDDEEDEEPAENDDSDVDESYKNEEHYDYENEENYRNLEDGDEDEADEEHVEDEADEEEVDEEHVEDEGDEDYSTKTETLIAPSELDVSEFNIDSLCASLEGQGRNAFSRRLFHMRARALRFVHRTIPSIMKLRKESDMDHLDSCITQAREVLRKLESRKNDMESQMRTIKKSKEIDYGEMNSESLRILNGKCTKTKIMQYEFEHCPFDLVRQYEHGSAIASLGKFAGWETHDKFGYVMKYEVGDKCWNGPVRNIKVSLVCGDVEQVLSVDEHNRCSYFMKFSTPAMCEQSMVDDLYQQFKDNDVNKEEL